MTSGAKPRRAHPPRQARSARRPSAARRKPPSGRRFRAPPSSLAADDEHRLRQVVGRGAVQGHGDVGQQRDPDERLHFVLVRVGDSGSGKNTRASSSRAAMRAPTWRSPPLGPLSNSSTWSPGQASITSPAEVPVLQSRCRDSASCQACAYSTSAPFLASCATRAILRGRSDMVLASPRARLRPGMAGSPVQATAAPGARCPRISTSGAEDGDPAPPRSPRGR